jgi:phosphatidylglycerol lysyltransferase
VPTGEAHRFLSERLKFGTEAVFFLNTIHAQEIDFRGSPELRERRKCVAGIYVIATWAGLISHVPGGVGVFEAVMILLLPNAPQEQLIAALLAYRAIYYILPLIVAVTLLTVGELVANHSRIQHVASTVGRNAAPVLAPMIGLLVFLGGIVLLISGSTPAIEERMGILKTVLPLPLIELSHVIGSLSGVGLLILARGLFRRLNGAFLMTAFALWAYGASAAGHISRRCFIGFLS